MFTGINPFIIDVNGLREVVDGTLKIFEADSTRHPTSVPWLIPAKHVKILNYYFAPGIHKLFSFTAALLKLLYWGCSILLHL